MRTRGMSSGASHIAACPWPSRTAMRLFGSATCTRSVAWRSPAGLSLPVSRSVGVSIAAQVSASSGHAFLMARTSRGTVWASSI
jgi:hypothetical protein